MKVKNRVKTHQDFQKVINAKISVANKTYVLYHQENDLGYSRIGISTSKKLGNAVIRGRIRRQVRVIAKAVIGLENSEDYVIIVRKEYLKGDFLKNQEELRQLYIKTKKDFQEEKLQMKKKSKIFSVLVALFIVATSLSSCTKSFCSVRDKASMLAALDVVEEGKVTQTETINEGAKQGDKAE